MSSTEEAWREFGTKEMQWELNSQLDPGPFAPCRWPQERLPMLAGFGPLLPGAADKRPIVGDGWPDHPGLSVTQLHAAAPECVCWHIGAAPHHIAVDIDGARAGAFCQQHGCDPYTADTWRIIRTSNTDRLKVVFTVTDEQKAILSGGAKTVQIGAGMWGEGDRGEELAMFANSGVQIVVLGQHYTKESGFTKNDDQYAWAGRQPSEAQPITPSWFEFLKGVFCGERPLAPSTRRQVLARVKAGKGAYKGDSKNWINSGQATPCPMCGRDHSGKCSISRNGDFVWCAHGEKCSAPDCAKSGQVEIGNDGRKWGYVRTEDHGAMGERSLFKIDVPRPQPTPPMGGETFTPRDGIATSAPHWGQDDNTAEEQPPQPNNKGQLKQQQGKAGPKKLSHEDLLALVHSRAAELIKQKAPVADRIPLLRALANDLGLRLTDNELMRAIWKARREARGHVDAIQPGQALDLTEERWMWEGLLLVCCLNLLVGLPKAGKTSLLVAMIASWSRGATDYLGMPLIGPCPPVLLVGVDMPQNDWGAMLKEYGLLDPATRTFGAPIVGLFYKGMGISLDPEGVERIAAYAEKHPGLLILCDSYAELTKGLGVTEKDSDFAEPISDLVDAVAPFGATVVLLHHSGKEKATGSASEASRGTTALPALSSQNLNLYPAARGDDWAADRKRVIAAEGRGGAPVKLLVERVEGTWLTLGSPEAVERARRLEQTEEKLNDRQADALMVVRRRWKDGGQKSTGKEVAAELNVNGVDPATSVWRNLCQLERKGLLQKTTAATLTGREDRFWPAGQSQLVGGSDTLAREKSEEVSEVSEPSDPREEGPRIESVSDVSSPPVVTTAPTHPTAPAACRARKADQLLLMRTAATGPAGFGADELGDDGGDPDMAFVAGTPVELLHSDGTWLNGWRVATVVSSNIGPRVRIEQGSDYRVVGPEQIRSCVGEQEQWPAPPAAATRHTTPCSNTTTT